MTTSAAPPDPASIRAAFAAALARFDRGAPVWLLGHFDADGLAATAILARALRAAGWSVRTRIVGRGETPWGAAMGAELAEERLGGLVICDLGVRGTLPTAAHTIIIDHHVPLATPDGATVISGYGARPVPTTSLLAFWCAGALIDPEEMLWLAAIGLIGDMAEGAGFAEMARARRYGVTALREAAALVNAPRRTAAADASPALALLLTADGPKAITAGEGPDARALRAARDEVKAALDAARRIPPRVRDGVALISFASPCQIHPLLAQQWRGRLRSEIVVAANAGYRPGWVHFAARTARALDLVSWLAERRPPGAGDEYGSGHKAASGGALSVPDWNGFVRALGFGAEAEVTA
ncbi:MAG: DHH family phosphoesterase [Acetobacteraceae bacterium]|nr:DHH family phosphoesterase [Acetobacteraceae bacterium]